MQWVKRLLTEYRAGCAIGGIGLSAEDGRSCYRLIKRFGISDQAIIDTIRRAKRDSYQDPESKSLGDKLISTNSPGTAAICLVSLQNSASPLTIRSRLAHDLLEDVADDPTEDIEITQEPVSTGELQEDEEEEEQLPLHYCDEAMTQETRYDAVVVHEFDDTDCCKRCGMRICTAPDKPADATVFHVFFEDGPEDEEGLRACHECGQWVRRTKYDDWIENEEDDEGVEEVAELADGDEEKEDQLLLHWCHEAITHEARDDAILVHEIYEAELGCRRCGMPKKEVETTLEAQLERHALREGSARRNEGKVDWDFVIARFGSRLNAWLDSQTNALDDATASSEDTPSAPDDDGDQRPHIGFTTEEVRELADMLRAARDEPEPINEGVMETLAREGRPLDEGLMNGQYRCDKFTPALAISEGHRWVYLLHDVINGSPACRRCGLAAAKIEDHPRLPFELRGPFTEDETRAEE